MLHVLSIHGIVSLQSQSVCYFLFSEVFFLTSQTGIRLLICQSQFASHGFKSLYDMLAANDALLTGGLSLAECEWQESQRCYTPALLPPAGAAPCGQALSHSPPTSTATPVSVLALMGVQIWSILPCAVACCFATP